MLRFRLSEEEAQKLKRAMFSVVAIKNIGPLTSPLVMPWKPSTRGTRGTEQEGV